MKTTLLLLLGIATIACKKSKEITPVVPEPTIAQKVTKTWIATEVTENGTIVYSKNGANNTKAAYSKFKLDLSSSNAAILTEFDGNAFTGTWEVTGQTLTLKGLKPKPSQTEGTVEYAISEVSTTKLKLSRNTVSAKTGGNAVAYILE